NMRSQIGDLRSLLRFEWQACFFPRLKTNKERMDILVAMRRKLDCYFGARSLMRTRAVCDHGSLVRDLGKMLLHFIGGHSYRARQFGRGLAPGVRIARVYKSKLFATI